MPAFAHTGPEFRVDTPGHGTSSCPTVTALASGGFVVSWTDNAVGTDHIGWPDIKARRYLPSGDTDGPEFFVNRETFDYQQDVKLAGLLDDAFVAVWQDFSGRGGDECGSSIKARVFGAGGRIIKNEFLVNQETKDNQTNPSVAALPHGGFVVAWQDLSGTRGDSSRASIKARLFRATGDALSDEFLVNSQIVDNQLCPSVAGLMGGGFVVAWNDFSGTLGDFSMGSIKAKVFDPSGATFRDEFLVNTSKWNNQNLPVVAGLDHGGFVIAWTDASGSLGDHSGTSIKARLFDELCIPASDEFLVNKETLGTQIKPCIATLTDGAFAIAWADYSGRGRDKSSSGIKAKLFSSNGRILQDDFLINTTALGEQASPTAAGLSDGQLIVCWQEQGSDRDEAKLTMIKGQLFHHKTQRALKLRAPAHVSSVR